MNRTKIKALAEGAVCSLIALALVLAGFFIPSFLWVTTVLAGVPMMYLGMRRGVRVIVVFWVISVLVLIGITGNVTAALLTGMMSFLPGIVLGYTLRTRKTFAQIIFSGAAVFLLALVLQMALLNAMGDGHGIADLVTQSLESVRRNMNEAMQVLEGQLEVQEQDLSAALDQVIERTKEIIFLYLPSFLIGCAIVMSYLLFMASTFILHRTRPVRIIYLPFWGITAPKPMCYVAAVLFLITSMSTGNSVWIAAIQNMVLLMYGYFIVCGMSFVDYKFRKRIPSGYVRGAIYGMGILVGYMLIQVLFQCMGILGILDGILRFRMREERIGHE